MSKANEASSFNDSFEENGDPELPTFSETASNMSSLPYTVPPPYIDDHTIAISQPSRLIPDTSNVVHHLGKSFTNELENYFFHMGLVPFNGRWSSVREDKIDDFLSLPNTTFTARIRAHSGACYYEAARDDYQNGPEPSSDQRSASGCVRPTSSVTMTVRPYLGPVPGTDWRDRSKDGMRQTSLRSDRIMDEDLHLFPLTGSATLSAEVQSTSGATVFTVGKNQDWHADKLKYGLVTCKMLDREQGIFVGNLQLFCDLTIEPAPTSGRTPTQKTISRSQRTGDSSSPPGQQRPSKTKPGDRDNHKDKSGGLRSLLGIGGTGN